MSYSYFNFEATANSTTRDVKCESELRGRAALLQGNRKYLVSVERGTIPLGAVPYMDTDYLKDERIGVKRDATQSTRPMIDDDFIPQSYKNPTQFYSVNHIVSTMNLAIKDLYSVKLGLANASYFTVKGSLLQYHEAINPGAPVELFMSQRVFDMFGSGFSSARAQNTGSLSDLEFRIATETLTPIESNATHRTYIAESSSLAEFSMFDQIIIQSNLPTNPELVSNHNQNGVTSMNILTDIALPPLERSSVIISPNFPRPINLNVSSDINSVSLTCQVRTRTGQVHPLMISKGSVQHFNLKLRIHDVTGNI